MPRFIVNVANFIYNWKHFYIYYTEPTCSLCPTDEKEKYHSISEEARCSTHKHIPYIHSHTSKNIYIYISTTRNAMMRRRDDASMNGTGGGGDVLSDVILYTSCGHKIPEFVTSRPLHPLGTTSHYISSPASDSI